MTPPPPWEVADVIRMMGARFLDSLTRRNGRCSTLSPAAEPQLWAGIAINAFAAVIRPSPSTHAAIATARSARSTHARSGSKNGARSCCPSDTSMSFLASLTA